MTDPTHALRLATAEERRFRRHGAPLGVCDYTPSPLGPPVYMCPSCRRFFPWCHGAASDDNPEFCDDCWAAARGDDTP